MYEVICPTKESFKAMQKLLKIAGEDAPDIIAIWRLPDQEKKKPLKDTENIWCDLEKAEVD